PGAQLHRGIPLLAAAPSPGRAAGDQHRGDPADSVASGDHLPQHRDGTVVLRPPHRRSAPGWPGAAVRASRRARRGNGGAAPAGAPAPAPQVSVLRSDPACVASFDAPGARERIRAPAGELKIGALAGLKDGDEENVAWIRRLVAELKRRGAGVLVADGDVGDIPDEQETLLGLLAESGLPVLV